MMPIRAAIAVGGIALAALILWAAIGSGELHGSFFDQFAVVTTLPWGVVSLFDVYLGLGLFAVIIIATERSWGAAIFWTVPLLILGNVWAALWLVIRLPRLAQLFSANREAPPPTPPQA